ncbi:hypothetical protein ACFYS8_17530 [Kitasatospora sp. NPDC004615]|uniref:hypothetical protein n=1 Tax=Kitasatospora sp. NPDC004615 TaxID=3364017 RepID=UPI0036C77A56
MSRRTAEDAVVVFAAFSDGAAVLTPAVAVRTSAAAAAVVAARFAADVIGLRDVGTLPSASWC